MNTWKQLQTILLLPGTVTVVVPATILYCTGAGWPSFLWNVVAGAIFVFIGLFLLAWTIRLFNSVGKGTLAPWNPTQKIIVRGVYRHVRNPMITGVSCILLGEAAFFGSMPLLCWFGFFVVVNMIYIPLREEPGLAKRFGDDYLHYIQNVPRWIPRLTPWQGLAGPQNRSRKEIAMNDVFEKRVRAAAIAGWWTLLIAVGFITLIWVIYLGVMSARPAWFLAMWGPDTDWAFVRIVWFWAIAFLKFVLWLMALATIWLTLWARQLRKHADGR